MAVKSIRRKRIASIFQHYYPEGGWGFIVLFCGLIVELVSNGLQQSFGILIVFISIRFRVFEIEEIGKKIYFLVVIFSDKLVSDDKYIAI